MNRASHGLSVSRFAFPFLFLFFFNSYTLQSPKSQSGTNARPPTLYRNLAFLLAVPHLFACGTNHWPCYLCTVLLFSCALAYLYSNSLILPPNTSSYAGRRGSTRRLRQRHKNKSNINLKKKAVDSSWPGDSSLIIFLLLLFHEQGKVPALLSDDGSLHDLTCCTSLKIREAIIQEGAWISRKPVILTARRTREKNITD